MRRWWLKYGLEAIDYLAISHSNQPNSTRAGRGAISCFEVDSGEIQRHA
jgi:hypothetical protein